MASEKAPSAEGGSANRSEIVRVDSGQALHALTKAITQKYILDSKKTPAVRVVYRGGGIKTLCAKTADIAEASLSPTDAELMLCKENGVSLLSVSVAFDALVIAVNNRNPASSITLDALRTMWSDESYGKVSRWDQVDPGYVARPLKLYGPDSDAPVSDSFSFALFEKNGRLRGDVTVSGDDELLTKAIGRDVNAVGYVGYSQYSLHSDRIKALAVVTEQGLPIVPTPENIRNGAYRPLGRTLKLYINNRAISRPEVIDYLEFYLMNAPDLAKDLKYVALDDLEYRKALGFLKK